MVYKGKNKHTQEELEEIIDSLKEKIIDLEEDYKREKLISNEAKDLIRDVYDSAKTIQKYNNENNLSVEDILTNVIKNFEGFSKNYKFKL